MSEALHVPEKSHASLGASVAARWMACPGSVRLSESLPDADASNTSVYAQEGTRAHALAQRCLEKGKDPDFFVGMFLEGGPVTDEMAEHVRVYVNYCLSVIGWAHWIEQKFSLEELNPPAAMFGTADFVSTYVDVLHVVDLKYGQGVVVEAVGNKQLRYYALGALLSLDPQDRANVRLVQMTIVQPRAQHPDGPIRSEIIPLEELLEFAGELLAAARATQQPNAPFHPGPHCRFCPAGGICKARHDHAQLIAQMEFAAAPLDQPRAPETLSDAELVSVLRLVPMLEDWAKAVRAHAQAKLERGESVPGYKLVARRANRQWIDEAEAEKQLRERGLTDDDILVSKLKSPAQVEKVTGKKAFPAELTKKESSGYTMARDADARPEVSVSAGEEFMALGPGE